MTPITVTVTLAAASANNIALSQTPAGAGNLTLSGSTVSNGVATLDAQRQVIVTSAGNDTTKTFTVYGTNASNVPIQQSIAGGNAGAVATSLSFLTVTRVAVSAATASTVTVGTNTTGSSDWKMFPWHMPVANTTFQSSVSGSATYNIETTNDDFATPATPTTIPRVSPTSTTGATGNTSSDISIPWRGWRVTVTSGTGVVTTTAIQAGLTAG